MSNDTTIESLRSALESAKAHAEAAEEAWFAYPADEEDEHVLAYSSSADDAVEYARTALRDALVDSDLPRSWSATEETGSVTKDLGELTIVAARETARAWASDGNYDTSEGTVFQTYRIRCEETGEDESVQIELQPEEPSCTDVEHDWQSPIELVGGIAENPGVWGHGGGVVIHEVCMHCGCERVTDTWAQDRATGRQGLESVRYEPGKYADEVAFLRAESAEDDAA